MKLDEEYGIEKDGPGWVLKATRMSKNPRSGGASKPYTRYSYHGTLKQALEAYVDAKAGEHSGEVADILLALRDCRRAIEAIA